MIAMLVIIALVIIAGIIALYLHFTSGDGFYGFN